MKARAKEAFDLILKSKECKVIIEMGGYSTERQDATFTAVNEDGETISGEGYIMNGNKGSYNVVFHNVNETKEDFVKTLKFIKLGKGMDSNDFGYDVELINEDGKSCEEFPPEELEGMDYEVEHGDGDIEGFDLNSAYGMTIINNRAVHMFDDVDISFYKELYKLMTKK